MKTKNLVKLGYITKPRVKGYQKSPGDDTEACHAAAYYAAKNKADIVIVPGNSFGHKVLHLARRNEDLRRYVPNIGDKDIEVYVVNAEGEVFKGLATV